jgi:hypothetical protein
VVPVTFMIVMSWACESDARRFGRRVTEFYGQEGDDAAVASARAAAREEEHRARTLLRATLLVLSIALPLAFLAGSMLHGHGPLGIDVPRAVGALVALALVIAVAVAASRG